MPIKLRAMTSLYVLLVLCYFVCDTIQKMQIYNDLDFIEADNENVIIICPNNGTMEIAEKRNMYGQYYKKIWIQNCPVPQISYYESFAKLNISTDLVEWLALEVDPLTNPIKAMHFQNLSLKFISIRHTSDNTTVGNSTFLNVDDNFMESQTELEQVRIVGVKLLPIVLDIFFSVNGNSSTNKGGESKAGCAKLKLIEIERTRIEDIPENWLTPCKELSTIRLKYVPTLSRKQNVLKRLFAGTKSLQELSFTYSYIHDINEELEGLNELRKLDVSQNQLHQLLKTTQLPLLVDLDISSNHFWSSALLTSGLVRYQQLQKLSIGNNPFLNLCDRIDYRFKEDDNLERHSPFLNRQIILKNLKHLSIRATSTPILCLGGAKMDALEYVDFTEGSITALELQELPQSKSPHMFVDVTGNPIDTIYFNKEAYDELNQPITVHGLNLTLNCDCQYAWLARAMRNKSLVLDGVKCNNASDVLSVDPKLLECDKRSCDNGCWCRSFWSDHSVDVTCEGALRFIPKVPKMMSLNAAGNLVESFSARDLTDDLHLLDLRRNHLSRIDESTMAALFNVSERRVKLGGNPILCDCENKQFITKLQENKDKIEDFDDIRCVEDGRAIRDIVPDDLCVVPKPPVLVPVLVALGVLASLGALASGLYYRYGRQAKVFLYARGCCLCCVREEELDADRPYDAFVSFSHKDENFVVEQLLPVLEQEPNAFRLNVHYRDWCPGELIPTQITRSVEQSRRTIIVLSRNFLQSVWGLLEFRTAHVSALREGRVRVIVLVLDDVLDAADDELDAELRGYLRTNTYVRWKDPGFWDKLRYALPHRKQQLPSVPDKHSNVIRLTEKTPQINTANTCLESEHL